MDSDVSKTKISRKLNINNEDDEVYLPKFLHIFIGSGGCRNEISNDKGKTIRNFTSWK